jgi:hypothetical protein
LKKGITFTGKINRRNIGRKKPARTNKVTFFDTSVEEKKKGSIRENATTAPPQLASTHIGKMGCVDIHGGAHYTCNLALHATASCPSWIAA